MIAGRLDTSALVGAVVAVEIAADNWEDAFEVMGADVRQAYQETWEREGPGWGTDLIKTGALWDSFTKLGAIGNVAVIGRQEASFGSKLPYAETIHTDRGLAIAREPGPKLRKQLTQAAAEHIGNALDGVRRLL